MLAAGSPVHVRKLKPDGALDYAWSGRVLRCDASGIVIRAEFNIDVIEREFAAFRRGDVFVEFYYFDPSSSDTSNSRGAGVASNTGRGASDVEDPSTNDVRYYNVFQISTADGTLKGWYCNLGLPAQLDPESRQLSYVDLALDVWANPDGSFVVLDDDELDELLEHHPELGEAAQQGRMDLINLAQSQRLPRWPD